MVMKSMNNFMISQSYSEKKLKNKNCTQILLELTTKKSRLLWIIKKPLKKMPCKKKKHK